MYKDLIKKLGKSILYTVKWEKGHMIDYLLQRDVTKKFYFHCADSLTCGWFSTTSITTKPTCKRGNFITSSHELSNVVGRLILMHDFYFRFQPFFTWVLHILAAMSTAITPTEETWKVEFVTL